MQVETEHKAVELKQQEKRFTTTFKTKRQKLKVKEVATNWEI